LGKLRILSGREICKILEQHGFAEVGRKGSNIALQKRAAESTITEIVFDHKEVKMGTLQSVIGQSRLARALFES